jgi:hypothetical protein
MATKRGINAGADHTLQILVVDEFGAAQNMTGWSLEWVMRDLSANGDGTACVEKTTGLGQITITSDGGTNNRADVVIQRADTLWLTPAQYSSTLWRTNNGVSTVLWSEPIILNHPDRRLDASDLPIPPVIATLAPIATSGSGTDLANASVSAAKLSFDVATAASIGLTIESVRLVTDPDDTLALNRLIAIINAAGHGVIALQERTYVVPDGNAVSVITVPDVHVHGMGTGTIIQSISGTLFKFGDGAAFVQNVSVRSLRYQFPTGNTNATGRLVRLRHGVRLEVADIMLVQAPGLVEAWCEAGRIVGDITINNVTGSTANVAASVIWIHCDGATSNASGLYLGKVRLYPPVGFPAADTTTPHPVVAGCEFLTITGNLDTAIISDTVVNRYHRGVHFTANAAGVGIGNVWFKNFVCDYAHTAVELDAAGGNISAITFDNAWLNSTDGRTIQLTRTAGLMAELRFINGIWPMSGTENLVIPSGSSGVQVEGNQIWGTGRLAASDGIRADAGADDYDISGNRWIDPAPFYGAGGVHTAARAIVVVGTTDAYRITDNETRGGIGYTVATSTSGGRRRICAENRRVGGALPEYAGVASIATSGGAGATTNTLTNHSGQKRTYFLRGFFWQVDVDGVPVWSGPVADGNSFSADLSPGEGLAYTFWGPGPFTLAERVAP